MTAHFLRFPTRRRWRVRTARWLALALSLTPWAVLAWMIGRTW